MGITVTATDPQFVFPPGSPYAGKAIGATLELEPILGGYTFPLCVLTFEGWETQEWLQIQSVNGGSIISQSEVDAAGGEQAYVISQAAAIYAAAAAVYPNDPPTGWVEAYNPPTQTYDPVLVMHLLVAIYGAANPPTGSPLYETIVPLRDFIIETAQPGQIARIIANVPGWQSQTGATAQALLAWLHSID